MKCKSLVLVLVVVFVWIWSLPLLILGAIFLSPVALMLLPVSFLISILVQRCPTVTKSPLRSFVNELRLFEWFPCDTVQVQQQTVIAVHPHGLLCCGALAGIHFVPGSTTIMCVAPILFYIPILGWSLPLLGCIPADYSTMRKTLEMGHTIVVVPGGVPEIVLSEQGEDTALYPRYGFLKLATATGTSVMSVFVQGECSTFQLIPLPFRRLRAYLSWLTNIPLVLPLVRGHWGTWLPKQVTLRLKTRLMNTVPSRNAYQVRLTSMMKRTPLRPSKCTI